MSATSDIDVLKYEMRPFVKRSVTTAPGNVAGTTLVDAGLTEPNDYWNGMCILIRTAGATTDCSGQLRRVLDWDLATNTLTVNVPFTDPLHPADPKIEAGIQYVMQCPSSDPEVVAIEAKLDDPAHGLVKIKDEVANIETAVAPANGTTSANGNPGGTTVIDTNRTEPNDHWNTMALLITSGAQNGQVREITDWVVGTGTFTVAPAFGGQILADVTYKILSHLPADIDIAAIEAKLDDPGFGLVKIKEEIVDIKSLIDAIEAKLDVLNALCENGSFLWDTSEYSTDEIDISALFTTDLTGDKCRKYTIFLDMTGPAADAAAWTKVTVKVKVRVDGTNYRTCDKEDVTKASLAAAEEPCINIDIPPTCRDVQITLQFDVALAADQTIYYTRCLERLQW